MELFAQHKTETKQLFELKVKQKIDYKDYLKVKQWYLTRVIDKNISNVIKVAKQHRKFVEGLLFINDIVKFLIDKPAIEALHINGLNYLGR